MTKVALILVLSLLLPLPAAASMQGLARIVLVEGDVLVRMADTDDWVPAAPNTPLEEGDSVWSPDDSRAEIQLRDGSYIRLDRRTALDIVDAAEDGVQFHMSTGRAYVRTGTMRGASYQFDLTDSTVTVSEKARLRLDINAEGDEDISVIKGAAYVEGYGTRTTVRSGEMMSLEGSRAEILPLAPPDAWEKWNRKRDKQLKARAKAARRLPEELAVYEDELSRSGEWVEVRDYGRVWRPTVVLSAEWAPYRVGRWVWRGGDYVWVSYESWGWAPYHYGRWVVLPRWGWCWVPPTRGEVYWAPAYVGWVTTPTHVGWVPLAPGEIYYGRGYYGRGSVNITNVTNINVTNVVYRNHRVNRNAVTVVQRDTFATERMRPVRTRVDIVTQHRSTASRPEPPPTRAARMPIVKSVAPAKLPPPRVAQVPARELKQRLPRVRNPESTAPTRSIDRPVPATPAPRQERSPEEKRGTPARPDRGEHRSSSPGAAEQRQQADRQPAPPSQPQPQRERRTRREAPQAPPPSQEGTGAPAAPAREAAPAPAPPPRGDAARGPAAERRVPRNVWQVRPGEQAQPRTSERGGRPGPERPQRGEGERPGQK